MGISRGTLREALRQLEYEGLIEVGERGRLTVRTLTEAELADMFTVRAALEGLAAATISTRPDRAMLVTQLQTALDALEAADGSISDMVEADLAFHRLLCELTGNATLVRAWETLTGPIRMAIMFAGPATAVANMSAARHQHLVDAIASGDPATARAAVDAHMREAARTLARLRVDGSSTPRGTTGRSTSGAAEPPSRLAGRQSTDSDQHAMLWLNGRDSSDDVQRAGDRGEPGWAGQDQPARAGPGPAAQRGHLG